MSDRPVDVSPLDPRRDPDRLERAVASILRAAAPELARRRAPAGVLGWLERFSPLGLAASAAVLALSLAALLTLPRTAATSDGIGESLGLPEALVAWADSSAVPGPGDLLFHLEELPVTGEVEALGRIRLRGLLLLAAVFLAGAFAGAAGERMLTGRREPPPFWSHAPGRFPPVLDRLDLSEAQRHEIEAILDRTRPMSDSLMQVTMPSVRKLMEETHRAIREVLTPAQREVFDKELKRGGGRRGHFRPRGDRHGPGAPGWGPPPLDGPGPGGPPPPDAPPEPPGAPRDTSDGVR